MSLIANGACTPSTLTYFLPAAQKVRDYIIRMCHVHTCVNVTMKVGVLVVWLNSSSVHTNRRRNPS